jgi:hypothetical protein
MNDSAPFSANGTNETVPGSGMGGASFAVMSYYPTQYSNEGEVCDGIGAQSVWYTEGGPMTWVPCYFLCLLMLFFLGAAHQS